MKVAALRVSNYKGFFDSGFVQLSSSWNVIVGQNNAGKTAFIEGFRLNRNVPRPHKSISFPRDFPYPTESRFTARMNFSRAWLKNCWLRRGGPFELPIGGNGPTGDFAELDLTTFWEGADLNVEIEFQHNPARSAGWPSHGLFEASSGERYVQIYPTPDRKVGGVGPRMGGSNDSLPIIVQQNYAAYIYMFEA